MKAIRIILFLAAAVTPLHAVQTRTGAAGRTDAGLHRPMDPSRVTPKSLHR